MKARALVGFLVAIMLPGIAGAQTISDLAKQAAQKDKDKPAANDKGKPVAKTFTNDSLKPDPTTPSQLDPNTPTDPKSKEASPPTDTKSATPPADAKSVEDGPSKPTDLQGHDEAYWRGRMAPLLERSLADMHGADLVAQRLNETKAVIDKSPDNPYILTTFGPEVVRLSNELKDWTARMKADNAAIDALKEEGRKAGAFPGWFR